MLGTILGGLALLLLLGLAVLCIVRNRAGLLLTLLGLVVFVLFSYRTGQRGLTYAQKVAVAVMLLGLAVTAAQIIAERRKGK